MKELENKENPKFETTVFFSFCIYGTQPIYCEGLLNNLKRISEIKSKIVI